MQVTKHFVYLELTTHSDSIVESNSLTWCVCVCVTGACGPAVL